MASLGILFPHEVVGKLSHLRGEEWQKLIQHIFALSDDDPDSLAFGLMMVRLCGCARCTLHEYRLRKGCTRCALDTIRGHKDSDRSLLRRFIKSQEEIQSYLDGNPDLADINVALS